MDNGIELFDRGMLFELLDRRDGAPGWWAWLEVSERNERLAVRLQCLGGLMGEW